MQILQIIRIKYQLIPFKHIEFYLNNMHLYYNNESLQITLK